MMYLIANYLGMNRLLGLVGMVSLIFGILPEIHAQAMTAQQKERISEEENKGPLLFDYDSTYISSLATDRAELLRKKTLIDSLDISDTQREKLIRDLYKSKPTKRLTKALLAATITKEDDLTGDPEQDR